MFRLILSALILCSAGCGKSFQEANAIYRDELAKLSDLKAECDAELSEKIAVEKQTLQNAYFDAEAAQQARVTETVERMRPKINDYAKTSVQAIAKEFQHEADLHPEKKDLMISDTYERLAKDMLEKLSRGEQPEPNAAALRDLFSKLDERWYFQRTDVTFARFGETAISHYLELVASSWDEVRTVRDEKPLPPGNISDARRQQIEKELDDRYGPVIRKQQEKVEAAYQAKEAAK